MTLQTARIAMALIATKMKLGLIYLQTADKIFCDLHFQHKNYFSTYLHSTGIFSKRQSVIQ